MIFYIKYYRYKLILYLYNTRYSFIKYLYIISIYVIYLILFYTILYLICVCIITVIIIYSVKLNLLRKLKIYFGIIINFVLFMTSKFINIYFIFILTI